MENISITITGKPNSLREFLKNINTSNTSIVAKPLVKIQSLSKEPTLTHKTKKNNLKKIVEWPYSYYSSKSSYQGSMSKKTKTLANNYLKENEYVRFMELCRYIKDNSSKGTSLSYNALKNYLVSKQYKKCKLFYEDNSTQIIWKK